MERGDGACCLAQPRLPILACTGSQDELAHLRAQGADQVVLEMREVAQGVLARLRQDGMLAGPAAEA